jgi:hypothetical protein
MAKDSVAPAFYFAFAGRDSFVRGIRLVVAKPSPSRRKR